MTVFKRADSSNWMIEFRYLGEHVRQTSATSSKAKAKELEAQWRREIHDRKAVGKLPSITLGMAIDRYFDAVLVPKGRPKTRKKDLYYLNAIRRHFGPDIPLDKITAADIAAFRDGLVMVRQAKKGAIAAPKIKPSSANRFVSYLRSILNRAVDDWHVLGKAPAIKLHKEPPGRVRWLEVEEEKKLLDACNEPTRNIVMFLMDSGCRKEEAITLTWKQVMFDDTRVRVILGAEDTKNKTAVGKPLPSRSGDLLRKLRDRKPNYTDRVFLHRRNEKRELSPYEDGFDTAFNAACRRAGIKDFRIHDLRHHYATKLARKGVSIQKIAKALNQKSTRMAERYAHLAPGDLDDAIELLD
jgi:integrase